MRSRIAFLVGVLVLSLAVADCSKKPRRVPGVIPVKVWVILGTDANEQLGSPTNKGCRFTRAMIEGYIAQLHTKGSGLFGLAPFEPVMEQDPDYPDDPNAKRLEINIVNSGQVGPCVGACDRRVSAAYVWHEVTNEDMLHKWAPDHLNLYFAGYLQRTYPSDEADAGLSEDPREAGTDVRPWIVLNDIFGPWYEALVLEHEVAHYLLDRKNVPPYGQPPLPPGGEHVPDTMFHLMRVSPWHPESLPWSERMEIQQRIRNGTWPGATR